MDVSESETLMRTNNLHDFSNLSVGNDLKSPAKRLPINLPKETYTVKCPRSGNLNVIVQGNRSSNEVCVLTAHDLGCNWKEFNDFLHHSSMPAIASRVVWVHLVVPGQEEDAVDLPANYKFPSLQDLADDVPTILDQLNVSSIVLFGEGAGANILLRVALSKDPRVLGTVLINATGSAAGFMETHREKAVIGRRLSRSAMNSAIEQRLAGHRFGASKGSSDVLVHSIDRYCEYMRSKMNQKNLAAYANAFFDRSNLSSHYGSLQGNLLLIAGSKSEHAHVAHTLHASILRSLKDNAEKRRLVEFLRVDDVVSVMHEKPEKLAECLQYFLQGLGLLSGLVLGGGRSVPVVESQVQVSAPRSRSLSMADYDKPRGVAKIIFDPERKYSES